MKYFIKTPQWLKWCFPKLIWDIPTTDKVIYLTFDDGPIPEVTPWVLEQLQQYQAKATFFVVGDNVRKHPAIFQRLSADGHRVGNHTFHHVNGKHTDVETYLEDVSACAELVETALFRPPYGRTTAQQRKALLADYQIIMWDVLSADFDPALDPEQCSKHTIEKTRSGSIVLFHDSIKAWPRLQVALPRFLEHFSGLEYRFEVIPNA